MDECARVMAGCLNRAIDEGWKPDEVRFVLFGDGARRAFDDAFRDAYKEQTDA
jgi:hypothetical protein